jgi:hypothetical protein
MKNILISILLITAIVFIYFYQNSVAKSHLHFYHWQQNYTVNSTEQPKYIKVLDISYRQKPILHKTVFSSKPHQKIVPVVYIDNPLFKHHQQRDFAHKVYAMLKELADDNFEFDEVQIDCDWSETTRKIYFDFLKVFKSISKKKVSITIRLHQVKYHKRTGVPPVDKGVLMYYNMANFKDLETKNYILDLALAKKYHHNFDNYPLPLDLALPLYAQATIIRFEAVVGIIEGVRKKDLNQHFKPLKQNHYEVTKTHYFKKRLLYEGDTIRVDEVSINDLQEAISNLKEVMQQPKEIILYRWGNRQEYSQRELESLNHW